jgi:hypothetical protein
LANGGTVALAEPNVENSGRDVIATDQSQSFLSIRCSHDASPGCAKDGMKVERDQRLVFHNQNGNAEKRHPSCRWRPFEMIRIVDAVSKRRQHRIGEALIAQWRCM